MITYVNPLSAPLSAPPFQDALEEQLVYAILAITKYQTEN